MFDNPLFISFIAYFIVMLGIGIYSMRFSSQGIAEYFVGGRKLGKFVVALSAVVSGRSAWVFLSLAGLAYATGPSALWYVIGFIPAEMLLFFFFANRVRRFAEKHDCITVPDLFSARLRDAAGIVRAVMVLIFIGFLLPYISAQFIGGGKALFSSEFVPSADVGLYVTAGIVLIYTLLGGFLAVSLTDTIQACFMIFGLIVLPTVVIANFGGLEAVSSALAQIDPKLVDFKAIAIGTAIGGVGLGLGSVGNPHITSRYLAIRNPDELRIAGVIGTVWNTLMCFGAIAVGLTGRAMIPDVSNLPQGKADTIFMVLSQSELSPWLAGILLSAVFAAIMSTADSQLLVAASAIVRDFFQKLTRFGKNVSDSAMVWVSRAIVFLLVVVAVVLGLNAEESLNSLIILAWSGPGAAIGPVALLIVFWKKTTWQGAVAGMLAGALMVIFWAYSPAFGVTVQSAAGEAVSLKKGLTGEIVPGFFVSLIACWLVSLATKPPSDAEELMADFSP